MTWARSLLLVPLVQRGRVLGLLWLTNSAPDSFSAAMAERLMPLANAAAIALENNRLLQDAQQHAEREERLNQIGVRSSSIPR
jgi:GAF domain-containing protein